MSVFKRSLQYLNKYKWLAIAAFLFMIIMTVCNLMIPRYIQTVIDDGITARNVDVIKNTTIILIIIAIVMGVSSFLKSYLSEKSSQGIAYDLRNQLYSKLENLEFSFHDKFPIGQSLTRTTSDVEAVRNFYANGMLQLFSALLMLAGSIGILFYTNVRLTGFVLLLIPVTVYIFFRLFKALAPIFGMVQKNLGFLNNILQENIEGVRVVKSFTAEDQEFKRYQSQNTVLLNANLDVINLFANNFPLIFFLTNLTTLIAIWVGGRYIIAGDMSVGELVSFNSYLTFLIQPIFQLGGISQQLSKASASTTRIFEILDQPFKIESIPGAIEVEENQPFHIHLRNVSFRFTEEGHDVISDISIDVPAGSTVAILGNTGSGKSSIVNLIPRFYDPTEGEVLLDGKNLKSYDLHSLRRHIGVVLQDIRLLHDTIRENVSFGNPNATDEDIMKACEIAQIADFIRSTPEGLDYMIGEGGGNLSGGQRQRIAIARMLLIEPRLLIMDDATSALDAETEKDLGDAIKTYLDTAHRTAVIISQKISTVKNADKIYLIDQGKVIDHGTHEDLLRANQQYRNLYAMQSEKTEQHA